MHIKIKPTAYLERIKLLEELEPLQLGIALCEAYLFQILSQIGSRGGMGHGRVLVGIGTLGPTQSTGPMLSTGGSWTSSTSSSDTTTASVVVIRTDTGSRSTKALESSTELSAGNLHGLGDLLFRVGSLLMPTVQILGKGLLGGFGEDVGLIAEAVRLLKFGTGERLEGLTERYLQSLAHDHLSIGNLIQDLFRCVCREFAMNS